MLYDILGQIVTTVGAFALVCFLAALGVACLVGAAALIRLWWRS
ncbi:hypothetical protein HOT42_gp06 [Microbacterium phage Metamorphoo]|uniref:Uncharacterized protein n=1 Tax=Microbacterium phage Metamorphoo TaxID=2201437 RepID=A0A2Z4Q5K6_9CAUD|nr:hypothetical protein HOT42_gp06 [Microbacterium phage Metamorphoo]AWY05357.1 hypothetical protein SEA_METAMORPHOO_6 [Microbacterium phage Metamorphoo]